MTDFKSLIMNGIALIEPTVGSPVFYAYEPSIPPAISPRHLQRVHPVPCAAALAAPFLQMWCVGVCGASGVAGFLDLRAAFVRSS